MADILDFNRNTPEAHLANRLFAEAMVDRLNFLCKDPGALDAIELLCNNRLAVAQTVGDHPSIQVVDEDGVLLLGFLGLINGLLGVIPEGPKAGWGYITAIFEDDEVTLKGFELTKDASNV